MSSMIKFLVTASSLALPFAAPISATATAEQQSDIIFTPGIGDGSIEVPAAQVDPSDGNLPAAIDRWRMLSKSGNYTFGEYASFLMTYPDWPNAKSMRRNAEQAINLNSYSPNQTVAYFDRLPPVSNTGRAKYAIALKATGDSAKAAKWGRKAWRSGSMTDSVEAALLGAMAGQFTSADHDARVDKLLWMKATRAASRTLPYTSSARRPLFEARIALKRRAANAGDLLTNAGAAIGSDAGVLAERALNLRKQGSAWTARELLANRSKLAYAPEDPEEWYEVLLKLAREAANDGQYKTAYNIASRIDDGIPAGEKPIDQDNGVRDDYTSLAWLAGTTAYYKLNRPQDAIGLFDRYGAAAKTPQTRSKGLYWAGKAAQKAGDTAKARNYFTRAAEYYDYFYGQLSIEALGRSLPSMTGVTSLTSAQAEASSVHQAARIVPRFGTRKEQTLFLRAIANEAENEQDYLSAVALSKAIGRPDLQVMAGRNARVDGHKGLIGHAYPVIPLPAEHAGNFTLIHAITRQESQFDREAISHAGARGLMQLMPGTARETSGRISMSYSRSGLTSNPQYNIRLGSTYINSMLRYFGGSYPLAVAAYNAGPGNVNKWLRRNGDPRTGEIGILEWIERIPIYETKNYVQRVLENAVMYDLQNPGRARVRGQNPLSTYLGKNTPG